MGSNKINEYIKELSKEFSPVDYKLFEEVKKLVVSNYGQESNYVIQKVIEYLDREVSYIKRHELTFDLSPKNHELIVYYIDTILSNNNHFLNPYVTKSIKYNHINSGWGDDISKVMYSAGILRHIIQDLKILQIFKKDEKILLTKRRDKHKIDNAIDTLMSYTSDPHLIHHLKELNIEKKNISKPTLFSCFFYQYTKMFIEGFNMNNSLATELSKEIMLNIFDSDKDYRIYKKIDTFFYREFTLTRYISK